MVYAHLKTTHNYKPLSRSRCYDHITHPFGSVIKYLLINNNCRNYIFVTFNVTMLLKFPPKNTFSHFML